MNWPASCGPIYLWGLPYGGLGQLVRQNAAAFWTREARPAGAKIGLSRFESIPWGGRESWSTGREATGTHAVRPKGEPQSGESIP